jgi:hypothetical protein
VKLPVHRIDVIGYKCYGDDNTTIIYEWSASCCDCDWNLTFDAKRFKDAFEHGYVHSYRMNRAAQAMDVIPAT